MSVQPLYVAITVVALCATTAAALRGRMAVPRGNFMTLNRLRFAVLGLLAGLLVAGSARAADQVLVEAESFADPGGWVLDTQFTHVMGSPYLLAHGMGE